MALLFLADSPALAQRLPSTMPHYTITAKLVPETHRIEAKLRLVFTNRSDFPIEHLDFHLYPNAFSHKGTVFFENRPNPLPILIRSTPGICKSYPSRLPRARI
ncbi:MAG: hypothetical protein IPJ88_11455 [Myxococcales bacterium]|nr:MAG: hypothetical protein IPJ88_11455 [Myxococcales bacterium]